MNPRVFVPSALIVVVLVVFGSLWTRTVGAAMEGLQLLLVGHFGWFYTAVVGLVLLIVLAMLIHPRFRGLRLGPPDSRPEYTDLSWFAMLFSAGMGIGLLFYSVAEPVQHYLAPPRSAAATPDAAIDAMQLTFFHWGLHPWAIYIMVALSLAYFAYRHDLPLSLRASLYPLIGDRIHGIGGDVVDVLAVVGTVLGVATSLGLGVMQVNAGLAHIGVMEVSLGHQVGLIIVIMGLATVSVISGLNAGIRLISRANLFAGGALLIFVATAGPTVVILATLVEGVGAYAGGLLELTFRTGAFREGDWQRDWTLFYWAWWIAWCPFVGMFIARVSRGRTVAGFIMGTLFVPTGFTFVWLAVFGATGLHLEITAAEIGAIVQDSPPRALFAALQSLPLALITVPLATAVIVGYFVTSADSGALVMNILASGGNPNPPIGQKLFWSILTGAVAAVLLVAGGLQALQTATLTAALPLSLVLLLTARGLWTSFRADAERAGDVAAIPEPSIQRLKRAAEAWRQRQR